MSGAGDGLALTPLRADEVPQGIPPELWGGQRTDAYVETAAGRVGTQVPFPGISAIHLDLPKRFARDWRLTCSAVSNANDNGGIDPLIELNTTNGGQLPIVNGPIVFPTAVTPGPALSGVAIDSSPAKLIMLLGSDRVFVDYPARGAVYQLSAHKLDVMVWYPEASGVSPSHTHGRYHLVLQPTYLPAAWNTPTYTTVYNDVTNVAGDYLCGAVPPRAVQCRLFPNDDNSLAGPPFEYAPNDPDCAVCWFSTSGQLLASWRINPNAFGTRVSWLWPKWAVPTRAAFVLIQRYGGSSAWVKPSLVWDLSL